MLLMIQPRYNVIYIDLKSFNNNNCDLYEICY